MRVNKNIIIPLFFILGAFILHCDHLLRSDEGVIINGAWNMYNNKILYKDFFEYIGPGSFYFVFFLFKIFYPSYVIVKFFSIIFLLISVYLIYKIFLFFSENTNYAYLSAGIWLLVSSVAYPLINHNTYSSILCIVALFILLEYSKKKNQKKLVLISGVLSGLTLFFLQTKGLVLFFSIVLYLTLLANKKNNFSHIFYYLLGFLFVFVPGIIFWGAPVFTNLFFISSNYLIVNKISHIPFFGAIVFLILIFIIFYRQKRINPEIAFLFFIQLFLFISILNRPDVHHLLINSFILIILALIIIEKNYQKIRKIKYILFFLYTACTIVICSLVISQYLKFQLSIKTGHLINEIDSVVGNERVYAHPFMPGIYFELGKINPYYTNVVEAIQGNSKLLDINFDILKKEDPKFIITDFIILEDFVYKKNKIDEYIIDNYHVLKRYDRYLSIWERN